MHSELEHALPEFRKLSLTGPKLLGTRKSRDGDEQFQAIQMALQGVDIGQRPSYWQPYSASSKNALAEARPMDALFRQYPDAIPDIQNHLTAMGRTAADVRFLPILAKESTWSALVDAKTGELVGFIPYDGFV